MNYKQALNKLKKVAFGIVVEDGLDANNDLIYYVLRFKADSELEQITETIVNGRIVAVKSGSEIYLSSGAADQ